MKLNNSVIDMFHGKRFEGAIAPPVILDKDKIPQFDANRFFHPRIDIFLGVEGTLKGNE